jgi:hypothetical protein
MIYVGLCFNDVVVLLVGGSKASDIKLEIEIEIEKKISNTIIIRLLSLGPPCYAKLGLISLGQTVSHY